MYLCYSDFSWFFNVFSGGLSFTSLFCFVFVKNIKCYLHLFYCHWFYIKNTEKIGWRKAVSIYLPIQYIWNHCVTDWLTHVSHNYKRTYLLILSQVFITCYHINIELINMCSDHKNFKYTIDPHCSRKF